MKKFSEIIKDPNSDGMRESFGIETKRDAEIAFQMYTALTTLRDKQHKAIEAGNMEDAEKYSRLPSALLEMEAAGYEARDDAEMVYVVIKTEMVMARATAMIQEGDDGGMPEGLQQFISGLMNHMKEERARRNECGGCVKVYEG